MNHIDVFQEEVLLAYRRFVTEVAAAARRAAHGIAEAAIGAAFDQVLGPLVHALAAPPPSEHPLAPHGPVAASRDPVAQRERVLAAIRVNPGSTTAQLRQALSLRMSSLLRQLRALIHEGAIRVEQQASPFRGHLLKLYFVVEPAPPARYANGEGLAERPTTEAPE